MNISLGELLSPASSSLLLPPPSLFFLLHLQSHACVQQPRLHTTLSQEKPGEVWEEEKGEEKVADEPRKQDEKLAEVFEMMQIRSVVGYCMLH
eukprot:241837-Hanusia_phi.AAC.2